MNLSDLTKYVWAQTDTTVLDLDADTIRSYLIEGFNRTIAAENRWPFYEQTWVLTVPPGETSIAVPIDLRQSGLVSLMGPTGHRYEQIGQEEAEERFGSGSGSTGQHGYFSLWADRINLWPQAAATDPIEFTLRGYRKPNPLVFIGGAGEVDADERLHRPLAHYAIALAYAQQEDEVLERTYMERWQKDVEMIRRSIMEPAHNRPLVLHGNFPRRRGGGGSVQVRINTP